MKEYKWSGGMVAASQPPFLRPSPVIPLARERKKRLSAFPQPLILTEGLRKTPQTINITIMKTIVIGTLGDSDYAKAMRRASRQEEISRHGKQIEGRPMRHASKKAYSRKEKYPLSFDY